MLTANHCSATSTRPQNQLLAGMLHRVTDSADPRMAISIGDFDETGRPIPMSVALLSRVASEWPTTSTTPSGVAEILRTSRQLFVHGYFVYEFVTVAVAWSLLAVEAALRAKLPGRNSRFKSMLKRAASEALLTPEMASRLDAGRHLRNDFSHPTGQIVWTLVMATGALKTSHEAVACPFPENH